MASQLFVGVSVVVVALILIRFQQHDHHTFQVNQHDADTSESPRLLGNSFGSPLVNATYDYIIVGGGTAGLAVAWKLATASSSSVAVIEAGSFYQLDNGNGSIIPALTTQQHIGWDSSDTAPMIDWDYVTEPQAGLNYRRLYYARGKTMGGSSARAHGAYMRGTKDSYHKWAAMVADDSYEFENLLPFFNQSCKLTAPDQKKRWPTNGTVHYDASVCETDHPGPLQVSWPNWAVPLGSWAAKAFEALAMGMCSHGFSSGTLRGSGWVPGTIDPRNAQRSSSQTSFWEDAAARTTIKAYTRTLAHRVLFDQSKRAVGVLVSTGGSTYHLSARKEVVLSAGAFNSPQLLMLSGIGPKEHLRHHNIPVIQHLPGVGQNLQDKTFVGTSFRVGVETSSAMANSPEYAAAAAQHYLTNQTGPLTNGPAFVAFERFPDDVLSPNAQVGLDAQSSSDWPHVEYLVENGFSGDNHDYATADPRDGYNYATISAALQVSLSRGQVRLHSADALEAPSIDPQYLSNDIDTELAVMAFKRVRQIWAEMSEITVGDEYYPGLAAVSSDAQILHYIRANSIQLWHASGTCKMGTRADPLAVVDSRSRVFGVDGLRVVDASVFPFLPPGHPLATVYAVALKVGADMLGPAV